MNYGVVHCTQRVCTYCSFPTGCGEHLTKTLLAKECADSLKGNQDPTEALSSVFQEKFLGKKQCLVFFYRFFMWGKLCL